jgi:iron complex outermembrane recepter protein
MLGDWLNRRAADLRRRPVDLMKWEISMQRTLDSRLSHRIRLILCGTTALLAASHAATVSADTAAADTASDTLEEVTVTAQRRVENARDVPISLTVFNSLEIEQQNFQGVDSYFAQTPNVSFTSDGTRDRKELALRGISDQLSPDNNIKEGSFGFYIDEFNVAQGTSNPEIVDIDRIEVLRGPQGTYFGRNAVGGAINITTKQPTNDFFAEASAQYSSFNTVDSHLILNLPLIDNVLAVRIVGQDETSDGNIKNINPIGGGNNSKYTYGKIIVRYTPNDRLTIDTTGTATKEDDGMRNGVPSGVLGDFSSELFGGPPYNGKAIPDGVGFYPNNTSEVNFNRPQDDGTRLNYVSNRIKYNADNFTVTNVVGYLYSNEFEGGDIDGSSLDLFYENESIKRTSLSEELRIQSIPGHTVDWTGGLYYGHDSGHTTQYTFAGADGGLLFGVPNGYELTSSLGASSDLSSAIFGEAVWHIDPRLSLTVGARYTHETVNNDGYNTSGALSLNYVNGTANFNNVSPRLSLLYLLSDQANLYATISRGFKAGGVEAQPTLNGGNQVYKPEILTNYEVGMKSESADKRWRLDADVFFMVWKDIQADYSVGELDAASGSVDFITGVANAASARSYGFETEFTALIVPGLTAGAGAGYDRAYYVNYNDAETGTGTQGNLSGATLPNAPMWTLHADTEYTHKLTAETSGFTRLEWYYKGGIVPDQNSEFHTGYPWDVPAYNVWNLRAGINRDTWSVTAFVENLLDKQYYTNAYEKAFVTGMFIEPSYRNIGVRLTVRTK